MALFLWFRLEKERLLWLVKRGGEGECRWRLVCLAEGEGEWEEMVRRLWLFRLEGCVSTAGKENKTREGLL